MLKLAVKDSYKRLVKVEIPLDMGRTERQNFTVEFKRLSTSEVKALSADFKSAANKEREPIEDFELMQRYLLGWEGVTDEDGNEVPFSPEALDLAMDIQCVRKALIDAFIEDAFGKEFVRKN